MQPSYLASMSGMDNHEFDHFQVVLRSVAFGSSMVCSLCDVDFGRLLRRRMRGGRCRGILI